MRIVREPRNCNMSVKSVLYLGVVAPTHIRHVPPRLRGRVFFTLFADAIEDKFSDYPETSICTLEDQGSGSVLPSFIPGSNNQDKTRADTAFEYSLKSAKSDKLLKVLAFRNRQHPYSTQSEIALKTYKNLCKEQQCPKRSYKMTVCVPSCISAVRCCLETRNTDK